MSLLSALSATRARKILLAFTSASVIAAGAMAPTSASAIYLPCWKFGTCKPAPKFHPGYGAAAMAGGIFLGALATGAAQGGYAGHSECVSERRKAVDEYGNVFFRNVRICY